MPLTLTPTTPLSLALAPVCSSSPVFNVKDYGAIGDGVANDMAAITATIAAAPPGATILIPGGVYRISGILLFTKPARVEADGATFLVSSTVTAIQVGASTNLLSDFRWHGGRIDNTAGYASVSGFTVWAKQRVILEGLSTIGTTAEGITLLGDGRTIATAGATATSATITDSANGFTVADVGKMILVYGAGWNGAALESQITAYVNAGQVTVQHVARTTISPARCQIMTHSDLMLRDSSVQDAGDNGIRVANSVWGGVVLNCSVKNGAASGAALFNADSPHSKFVHCRVMKTTSNAVRIDGYGGKVEGTTVTGYGVHGIRLQGEQSAAVNCDVYGDGTAYGFIILPNTGGGATQPRDCKIIGGSCVSAPCTIQDISGQVGPPIAPVVKGLTIEGSAGSGLAIFAGDHAQIDIIVRHHAGSGLFGGNGLFTGAGVLDVSARVESYGNAQWGVQTTGACDRWQLSGHARAADNTSGSTSLVGAGNITTGLIT